MQPPNWHNLSLDDGVLREPIAEDGRLVLWLPGTRNGEFREWRRVGNVARAEVVVEHGICSTAATVVSVRQEVRGFVGKLLQRFRKASDDATWSLPNGETA